MTLPLLACTPPTGDNAGYLFLKSKPRGMQATSAQPMAASRAVAVARDWVAWYEDLQERERREIRSRLLTAGYEEVKAEPDLRQYFFFHMEDIVDEAPPGSDRLHELHNVVQALRGATDAEQAETRRKAMAFLLAEYQKFLRDNPWAL